MALLPNDHMISWRLITMALALGLTTTIGVAWACAVLVDYADPAELLVIEGTSSNGQTDGSLIHQTGFGRQSVIVGFTSIKLARDAGIPYRTVLSDDLSWSYLLSPNHFDDYMFEEATGWPALCLSWVRPIPAVSLPSDGLAGSLRHGLTLDPKPRTIKLPTTFAPTGMTNWLIPNVPSRILPLTILVRGIILNTLFHALVWSGVLWARSYVVRRWRAHHGRCPNCNYDLRGERVQCPECGTLPVLPAVHSFGRSEH